MKICSITNERTAQCHILAVYNILLEAFYESMKIAFWNIKQPENNQPYKDVFMLNSCLTLPDLTLSY